MREKHRTAANRIRPPRCFNEARLRCAIVLAALWLVGCRTSNPLPSANLSEPGWRISHGQAVWRRSERSPEIAAELLIATNEGNQTVVEFTKTPLPILVAQTSSNGWRIELISENKDYSGRGQPPSSLLWFHLVPCIRGEAPPKGVSFKRLNESRWRLENTRSGELIEGYTLLPP